VRSRLRIRALVCAVHCASATVPRTICSPAKPPSGPRILCQAGRVTTLLGLLPFVSCAVAIIVYARTKRPVVRSLGLTVSVGHRWK